MSNYLVVGDGSGESKSYLCTSYCETPYLNVDTGRIPLTTATRTGMQLNVKDGGVTYRAMENLSTSESSSYSESSSMESTTQTYVSSDTYEYTTTNSQVDTTIEEYVATDKYYGTFASMPAFNNTGMYVNDGFLGDPIQFLLDTQAKNFSRVTVNGSYTYYYDPNNQQQTASMTVPSVDGLLVSVTMTNNDYGIRNIFKVINIQLYSVEHLTMTARVNTSPSGFPRYVTATVTGTLVPNGNVATRGFAGLTFYSTDYSKSTIWPLYGANVLSLNSSGPRLSVSWQNGNGALLPGIATTASADLVYTARQNNYIIVTASSTNSSKTTLSGTRSNWLQVTTENFTDYLHMYTDGTASYTASTWKNSFYLHPIFKKYGYQGLITQRIFTYASFSYQYQSSSRLEIIVPPHGHDDMMTHSGIIASLTNYSASFWDFSFETSFLSVDMTATAPNRAGYIGLPSSASNDPDAFSFLYNTGDDILTRDFRITPSRATQKVDDYYLTSHTSTAYIPVETTQATTTNVESETYTTVSTSSSTSSSYTSTTWI